MPLEQFTLLTDEEFYQIHGVEKQVPLLLALSNQEDWGYVAKKINRRNGKTTHISNCHPSIPPDPPLPPSTTDKKATGCA